MCEGSGGFSEGNDGTFAFRTPLATLHKFNGWADAFLVTPAIGLEDLYVFVGATLPWQIKSKLVFHWFFAHETSGEFGQEFDAVFSKAITKNVSALVKLAAFQGDKDLAQDRQKWWIQVEFRF